MITAAYDFNNIILMGARLPQILKNFQAKSTGQLSIITFAANTLGCIARLFTTMQEGGGSAMMRSYGLSECVSFGGREGRMGRGECGIGWRRAAAVLRCGC
jgi:hypothetical protein